MNTFNNIKFGMMANMTILMVSLAAFTGCKSVQDGIQAK